MRKTLKRHVNRNQLIIQLVIGLIFVYTLKAQDTLVLKMEMYPEEKRQKTEDLEFDSLFIKTVKSKSEFIPLARSKGSNFSLIYNEKTLGSGECIYGCVKYNNRYYPFALYTHWIMTSDTLQIHLYRSTNWFKKSYGVLISRGYGGVFNSCRWM